MPSQYIQIKLLFVSIVALLPLFYFLKRKQLAASFYEACENGNTVLVQRLLKHPLLSYQPISVPWGYALLDSLL